MEKESRVNPDNFIHIAGWMVTDLKLKGNDLIIYAIIYGFSQTEKQTFNSSLQYLADWTNSAKSTVVESLKKLVGQKLIEKIEKYENKVKYCEYRAISRKDVSKNDTGYTENQYGGIPKISTGYTENQYGGVPKISTGYTENQYGGIPKIGTNNIDNNITDNITDNIDISQPKKKQAKNKYGSYQNVRLTAQEYQKLIEDYGEKAIADMIQRLDEYMEEHGKQSYYKNHNLTLRKWLFKDGVKPLSENRPAQEQKSELDKAFDEMFA